MSVQDYLIEKGDVFYSCGGITVEDPKLQQCITHIDEIDRVLLFSPPFTLGYGTSSAMYPARHRFDQFFCLMKQTRRKNNIKNYQLFG